MQRLLLQRLLLSQGLLSTRRWVVGTLGPNGCYWVGALLMALVPACSDDDGGSDGAGGAPSCAPSDPACPALDITSDCLSLVDNTGKDRFVLRLAQLTVSAPEALTQQVVYNLIADGVNINLDACNVSGAGTFSLLTEFDNQSGELTIGGAFPVANPSDGYCYVHDAPTGIAPVTVQSNLKADGSFETAPISAITLPIFLDASATSAVYLPLSQARFTGGKLSADQNCIGSFNAGGLLPKFNCAPDPGAGIEYFINGASLEGFIRLEDADSVDVDLLGQSLCVLLSGDATSYGDGDETMERCKRDAQDNIELKGDWCSTTNGAGGCQDAFRLTAGLAASGAQLRNDCP